MRSGDLCRINQEVLNFRSAFLHTELMRSQGQCPELFIIHTMPHVTDVLSAQVSVCAADNRAPSTGAPQRLNM